MIRRLALALGLLGSAIFISSPANAANPCDPHPVVVVVGEPYAATVYVATVNNARLCNELDITGIQWLLDKPGKAYPEHYGVIDSHLFDAPGSYHFSLGHGPGHYALYGSFLGGVVFPNRLLSPTTGDISGISPVLTTLPNTYGTPSDITYLK